jgi:cysteine-rich repeat protein
MGAPRPAPCVWLLAAVLIGATRVVSLADGPSNNADTYSLLAGKKLVANNLHVANGNLGVNRGALVAKGALDAGQSQVVADRMKIAPAGSQCGAVYANHMKSGGPGCGPASAFTLPLVGDVGAACRFPAPFPACNRAAPVAVSAGGVTTLTPGVYGDLGSRRKPASGTVVLSGRGRYVFCNLWFSRTATLQVADLAEVDVGGAASFGTVQFTGALGQIASNGLPNEFRFFVRGPVVKFNGPTTIHHFCAPNAKLRLSQQTSLEGSFVGKVVNARNLSGMTVAISNSPRCGDSLLDPNEECDDGNNLDGDSCEADCTLPVCGNAILDAGEECDDGNNDDGDTCEGDCTIPRCGNGVLDPGEVCDDGADNGAPGDACTTRCTLNPGRELPKFEAAVGTAKVKVAGSALSVPVATTIPAGHSIIAAFAMDTASSEPTDVNLVDSPASGNIYTCNQVRAVRTGSSGAVTTVICWSLHLSAPVPASSVLILTHPQSNTSVMTVGEYSGLNVYTGLSSSNRSSTRNTAPNSNPVTLTSGDTPALLFGAIGVKLGAATKITKGTGWTSGTPSGPDRVSINTTTIFPETRVASGPTACKPDSTCAADAKLGSSAYWAAAVAVFK